MLKELHGHIVNELQQNARTDTIFVVSAVLFNLVVLGINWGVASNASTGENASSGNDVILGLLIVSTVLINVFSVRALAVGRRTRQKLLAGLREMYEDNDVSKYYSSDLLESYRARYTLFTLVLVMLGLIAIVVPLIARTMG
jgi:hypothetical protein